MKEEKISFHQYSLARAKEVANKLQFGAASNYEYRVIDEGDGFGRIDVYDEDHFLIMENAVFDGV